MTPSEMKKLLKKDLFNYASQLRTDRDRLEVYSSSLRSYSEGLEKQNNDLRQKASQNKYSLDHHKAKVKSTTNKLAVAVLYSICITFIAGYLFIIS